MDYYLSSQNSVLRILLHNASEMILGFLYSKKSKFCRSFEKFNGSFPIRIVHPQQMAGNTALLELIKVHFPIIYRVISICSRIQTPRGVHKEYPL